MIENLFMGIIIAVATSTITVWLALKRFRAERWWERKALAYSAIVESLHHMKRWCEEHIEALELHRDIPKDKEEALLVKFRKASEEIAKAQDVGAFIISNEAVKQLDALQKGLSSAENAEHLYDYLDMQLSPIIDCLNAIRKIAKNDLGVK
jgi:hypothetical protein